MKKQLSIFPILSYDPADWGIIRHECESLILDRLGEGRPYHARIADLMRRQADAADIAANAPYVPKQPGAKKYTTQYAVDHGRKLGWKLKDRESYDFRTKRHHDLNYGADVLFETLTGFVYVQAAGKGERAAHYERFISRGGPEGLLKLGPRWAFRYWAFERGNKVPLVEEFWE